MRKTLPNGSVLDGTPAEIAAYERAESPREFIPFSYHFCDACSGKPWFGVIPPRCTCGRRWPVVNLPHVTWRFTSTGTSQE